MPLSRIRERDSSQPDERKSDLRERGEGKPESGPLARRSRALCELGGRFLRV